MNYKGEIVVNGVIFATACFLFYVATTFPMFEHADKLGPAFWPKIILLLTIILSGTLTAKNGLNWFKSKDTGHHPVNEEHQGNLKPLSLAIAVSLIYGFSVPYTGFLLSIFLFQIIFLLILKVKKVWTLIFYPVSLTAVIYLIFIKILYIPLPRGQGIFLTFSRFFY